MQIFEKIKIRYIRYINNVYYFIILYLMQLSFEFFNDKIKKFIFFKYLLFSIFKNKFNYFYKIKH